MINLLLSILAITVGAAAEIPFAIKKFGVDNNYKLKMRALITEKKLEMQVCVPNGKWFGLGFGGSQMNNSELVFFFAGDTEDQKKVLSVKGEDQKFTGII